jgi:hypothetical protein
MKITASFLLEIDSEELVVELATPGWVADDGTKARCEQNLDSCELFHGLAPTHNDHPVLVRSAMSEPLIRLFVRYGTCFAC